MLDLHLTSEKGLLKCNAQKIEILIPKYFFDANMAEDAGTSIKTVGILPIRVYEKDKLILSEILNIATKIELYPKEQDEWTGVVVPDTPEYSYKVMRFYRGEVIMPEAVVANSDNVKEFLESLMGGKWPRYIPYNKLVLIWEKNLELNKTSLNVPIGILGLIISSIYRDRKDPNLRYVDAWKADPKKSQYDYVTASMREIAARSSTFAAITFEDQDAMITSALNNNKLKRKEKVSPIEKIIKM